MKISKGFGGGNSSPKNSEVSQKTLNKWLRRALKGDIQAQMNYTNFWRSQYNKYSYQEGSTMIHEKDYIPMDCYLCGKHMPSIHDTHNPQPITPKCLAKEAQEKNLPYRCCEVCNNTIVGNRRDKDIRERGGSIANPIFDFFQGEVDCLKDRDKKIVLMNAEEMGEINSLSNAYKEKKE